MHENLGRKAKDVITGFEGVATGYAEYVSGCAQFLLAAPSKDGKPGESVWVDEQRLKFTGKPLVLDNSKTPGCDATAPVR